MRNKKSKLSTNPKIDFLLKNYFLLTIIPWIGMSLWVNVFYILGRSLWERRGEGAFVYSIWAVFSGYFLYLLLLGLVIFLILLTNRRWMSGDKLTKKTRFGLFGLAFIFYLVTMWIVSILM